MDRYVKIDIEYCPEDTSVYVNFRPSSVIRQELVDQGFYDSVEDIDDGIDFTKTGKEFSEEEEMEFLTFQVGLDTEIVELFFDFTKQLLNSSNELIMRFIWEEVPDGQGPVVDPPVITDETLLQCIEKIKSHQINWR